MNHFNGRFSQRIVITGLLWFSASRHLPLTASPHRATPLTTGPEMEHLSSHLRKVLTLIQEKSHPFHSDPPGPCGSGCAQTSPPAQS